MTRAAAHAAAEVSTSMAFVCVLDFNYFHSEHNNVDHFFLLKKV